MISFTEGNNKFNFRVSCLIINSDRTKFITNTRSNIDFVVLPGGRVEMGESSEESLKREIQEELNQEINILGLKVVTENFFEFDDKNYHELQYVYVGEFVDKEIEKIQGRFMGAENKDIFEWHNIEELDQLNYTPKHLKQYIKEVFNNDFSLKHICHRGNG